MNPKYEGLAGKKILVVDDTPANIDILLQTLEPEGYKVSVASSGEVALDLVSQARPDLILLDIMMPGMDGYETCRRLKSESSTREIPIIFITAKNETADIVKGFSSGGVDFITKPFRHEEVCARIRTHLQLSALMKQLEVKNRQLEELNDLKNKFLGMASHDLRNPIASIQGYSKFLINAREGSDPETRGEFLNHIFEISDQMLQLLNDLLDISVIESGKLEIKPKPGLLKDLILERMRIHNIFAGKKKLSLCAELSDVPEFPFDSNRIGQVIDNLLSNAIKFSPAGKKVYIDLTREGKFAKVSVRDEGPGIPEEDQSKLFKHFQKLSAKPTGGESGSGLGLAIAQKMVDAHRGTLEVESREGAGATFCFKIPMDNVNEEG